MRGGKRLRGSAHWRFYTAQPCLEDLVPVWRTWSSAKPEPPLRLWATFPKLTCSNGCVALLSVPAGNSRQAVQSPGEQTPDPANEGGFRGSVRVAAGGVKPRASGGLQGEVTGQAAAAGDLHQDKVWAGPDLRPVHRAAGRLSGRRLKQQRLIKMDSKHTVVTLKSSQSWCGHAENQS